MDLADPFERLGGKRSIALLSADSVLVRRASALVEDLGERLPVLDVGGLSLMAVDVHAYMAQRRSGVRLAVGDAELDVDGLSTKLADGSELRIAAVQLSLKERRGRVLDLRHTAKRDPSDTIARPLMDLVVDSILLERFEVDRLISHQELSTGHVAVHGLRMEVDLDKTLGIAPRPPRSLPPQALLDLGFSVRMDTLSIHEAHVRYRERDDGTERWGEIPFTDLNAEFRHISNKESVIEENPRIVGEVVGLMFDTAQVSCRYTAELDGSQKFTLNATVSELPVVVLNGVTRPLMRVEMQGGQLEQLELEMEGDERKAKGSMAIRYTDLKLRVEPGTPRSMHNSMFGNVLETMLTEAYGGGLTADRERKFNIDRDPTRAFTGYLWHATREGLARNLTPEAWDRMREMLRSDAELRREQRAARRAKKQERKGP